MAQQEEERVNGQLVDILERRCAKLQKQLEEQTEGRSTAEGKLAAAAEELEELRPKVQNYEEQIKRFCSVQHDIVEERKAAAGQASALHLCESQRDEALRALAEKERVMQKLKDEFQQKEAGWKQEIMKLVAEAEASTKRAAEAEARARAEKEEAVRLTENAQDLVRRYEEESERRLELEEKFLNIEEKSHGLDKKLRADLDAAQQKAKRSAELQQRLEERCKALEAEVQQLRNRPASELTMPHGRPEKVAAPAATTSPAHASRIPQPTKARHPSVGRPGTGMSVGSNDSMYIAHAGAVGHPAQSEAMTSTSSDRSTRAAPQAAHPPGAIRRAGSVPTRRPGGGGTPVAKYGAAASGAPGTMGTLMEGRPVSGGRPQGGTARSFTPSRRAPNQMEATPAAQSAAPRPQQPPPQQQAKQQPQQHQQQRQLQPHPPPGSRVARPTTGCSEGGIGDLDIDARIPSEPDDSSDEEIGDDGEVHTAMRAGCVD